MVERKGISFTCKLLFRKTNSALLGAIPHAVPHLRSTVRFFIVTAAKPTFTRSRNASKWNPRNGINRHAAFRCSRIRDCATCSNHARDLSLAARTEVGRIAGSPRPRYSVLTGYGYTSLSLDGRSWTYTPWARAGRRFSAAPARLQSWVVRAQLCTSRAAWRF
jgi:hypothetical protein